jgi:hypothetical protein
MEWRLGTNLQNQNEAVAEIHKKIRTLWITSAFFGLMSLFGIMTGNFLLLLLGLVFVVPGIWAIGKFKRMLQNQLADYQPGKGFSFFRKTGEQKIKVITYTQIGMAGLILFSLITKLSVGPTLFIGLSALVYLQFVMKRRIKVHTKVDDATLFELEEIGIITPKDIVKALYKDFESWRHVQPNNKIFLVKQDALVCIVMQERHEAVRMECRLRDIQKLGIVGSGKNGEGLLLLIGTVHDNAVRLKLDGKSFQDSPEEFVSHFLQALDEALQTASPGTPALIRDGRMMPRPELQEHAPSEKPRVVIREIELPSSAASNNDSGQVPRKTGATGRQLDL